MNKVKRILAIVLAMAMMVAMYTVASAATITLNNVGENATIAMMQVIAADPTSATGWTFVNGSASAYETVFATDDDQAIIVALIKKVNRDATVPSKYANVAAATTAQLDGALSRLSVTGPYSTNVEAPGLYAIKVTEEGYTYKTMTAYVEFGETTTTEVTAKKAPITVGKSNTGDAEDNAAGIGDTVSFEVTTNFPYIDSLAQGKFYRVTDTITGANYQEDTVVVTLGEADITEKLKNTNAIHITDNNLVVDLSSYITADNDNANKEVVITYAATVTGTEVTNTANHEGTSFTGSTPAETKIYTGEITLTKYDVANQTKVLAGAGFNVVKVVNNVPETTSLKFREETEGMDGTYVYDPEGTVTEVKTGEDGKIVIKGLDEGTYKFNEVTAPEGYSINENGAEATLIAEKDVNEKATAIFKAETELGDSQLSALPSTGGIGTTIFTVVGCLIMIAAAAMFFVSRRKAEK